MSLGVLEGARFVCERARDVAIEREKLCRLAEELLPLALPAWDRSHHFHDGTKRTIVYLLLLDSQNFCFFPEPRWEVIVAGERLGGYFALTSVLKEAFENGLPVDDFAHLSQVGEDEVRGLLQGRVRIGEVPLLAERTKILREIASGILTRYGGDAGRLVREARGSAERLVSLLLEAFPSFRDEASYSGERIPFYKRAQIFAGDLAASFDGRSFGAFTDLPSLTAFADYKIPQILRACGALCYSEGLAGRVDLKEWIEAGSREEVEIRAATIWAVELLRQELKRRGRPLLAIEIDWLLWTLAQGRSMPPHHRTLTPFY